ncbi:MAG: dienelactone hydrolase family protein [Actinobacteria bacterium]|nr:dienelactone hydrolase family protein [Actinomycetota bacterium]
MIRRATSTLAVAVLLVAGAGACSSSDDASSPSTTAAATSTTEAADARPAYEGRGPHPVGSEQIALADGRRVVVWYPAADAAADQPKETFDIASLLSPDLQAQIAPELRPQYEIDAHPGADPATDGPFPVVLFSHGYAGFPEQSADLTSHLASWGFVVVAPDHVERSLSGLLGTASQGVAPMDDPAVLSASLDAATADAERDGSPLADLLDLDRVAVVGHSAGARAAYLTASSDDRIDAFVSYSVGLSQGPDDAATEAPPVPEVPGMVMLGEADGIIPADTSRAVYEGMDTPKYLVEIADAGHLVFSDICLIGRDQGGLVALVKEAGLDLPDQLLRLASDGCEDDALLPSKAFPAIDHFSVAFLRSALGIDEEPVGLDAETAAMFTTADVTFESDPG